MPTPARGRRTQRPRWNTTAAAAVLALLLLTVGPQPGHAEAGERAAPRIVGGTAAPIVTRPFQVALYDPKEGGQPSAPYEGQFCGGTILDASHVLTAGHCAFDDDGRRRKLAHVRVLAGTARLRDVDEAEPSTARDAAVAQFLVRPGVTPDDLDGDAAVLVLASPLYKGAPRPDGTSAIAPISPITPDQAARYADPEGHAAVVISGWGSTLPQSGTTTDELVNGLGTAFPRELRVASTHVFGRATCRGLGGGATVTDRTLCVGEPLGGIDSCSGDSGGPLTVDVDGAAVLAGIVSTGPGCAQPMRPGRYTRVDDPSVAAFVRSGLDVAAPAGRLSDSKPAPPPDTGPPTLRLASRRCSPTRCVVRVVVTDAEPTSGVRSVAAVLRATSKPRTRRAGRSTSGATARTRPPTVRSRVTAAGTGTIVVERLEPGWCQFLGVPGNWPLIAKAWSSGCVA